jgi:T-complex protein 1 subunit beta
MQEEKGEMARLSSFVGAIAVADLVKTTLGPKGMDKILQPMSTEGGNDKMIITNDGATILKSVYVDNAAARILIDISKTQDSVVGDGTTTVAVLAGELLREAEKLVYLKIHPQIIIQGFRLARDKARETLLKIAMNNSNDREQFRKDLINIAKTTLSSKLLTHEKEFFAKIVVDAVLRFKTSPSLDHIKILKKPGASLKDSFLVDGLLLEKQISVGCPRIKKNARILVANTPMDYDKIKIYGSRVKVDSIGKVAEIEQAEKAKMKAKVDKILAHNIDVFVNRQLIYNYPEQLLAEKGIMVIEHADFDGIERLAAVTGSDILSTFDNPEKSKLGHCDSVEEMIIGEDKVIKFSGCAASDACSIVLRGASSHLLDEAERSLHDALCVIVETVKSHNVVYGGGHSEMRMALEVDQLSLTEKGKESLAMEGFARALRAIPTIIADNAGLDSAEVVSNLKAVIHSGSNTAGININDGSVGDMKEMGVYECLKVKEQALLSACEATEMILRVDMVLTSAPRQRDRE